MLSRLTGPPPLSPPKKKIYTCISIKVNNNLSRSIKFSVPVIYMYNVVCPKDRQLLLFYIKSGNRTFFIVKISEYFSDFVKIEILFSNSVQLVDMVVILISVLACIM